MLGWSHPRPNEQRRAQYPRPADGRIERQSVGSGFVQRMLIALKELTPANASRTDS